MRNNIRPRGSLPVVRLYLANEYFQNTFVQECINDLEKKVMMSQANLYELTPLDRLAATVLLDSAYIRAEDYLEKTHEPKV